MKASVLLSRLGTAAGHYERHGRSWPGAPHILAGRLSILTPAMANMGLRLKQNRSHNGLMAKAWRLTIEDEDLIG